MRCSVKAASYALHVPNIRITVDGKLALTVEQAALRYGLARSSMRAALTRLGVDPVAALDDHKQLYLATTLDKAMTERPGRGAPGKPRKAAG